MTVAELISKLSQLDIRLWVEDGKLGFSAPEGVFSNELKHQVKIQKTEIIEFLSHAEKFSQRTIKSADRSLPLPLSFAQQRLWFLNRWEPESTSYNIPIALRLKGNLDIEKLSKAMRIVLNRHESLRTYFVEQDGIPYQTTFPCDDWQLTYEEWQFQSNENTDELLKAEFRRFSSYVFNITEEILVKIKLLRVCHDDYLFMVNMHHIISDGWSLGVVIRELVTLYNAFLQGVENPLPPLSIQYADFAVWQREWLVSEVLNQQLDFWRKQLDGVAVLELPTDYLRPQQPGFHGRLINFSLGKQLSEDLKKLCRQQKVTLFTLGLSAFKVLLYRYSGQHDICVGTPVANRTLPALEELIGFFVNTLPIRSLLDPSMTFSQLLLQTQEITLAAFEHQDLPFEKIVDELNLPRDISHSPIFQVLFSLQNNPIDDKIELPGLHISPFEREAVDTVKFDIELSLNEHAGEIHCALNFRTELFDVSTMEAMAEHYSFLLHSVVQQPEQNISALAILSPAQLAALDQWNETAIEYDLDQVVSQLFEMQVTQTPNNIAIRLGDQTLQYSELNEKANQLAHYLIERGVKPDGLVGICMKRSIEMIVGILGVLKAGGAYVPLDPSYPKNRLLYMLQDSAVGILLTHKETDALVSEVLMSADSAAQFSQSIEALSLWDAELLTGQSRENIDRNTIGLSADHICYMIYTSGSTGQPKGVMVEHRGVINYLSWAKAQYRMVEDLAGAVMSTSLSFDATVTSLFLPLCSGEYIYLLREDEETIAAFADLLLNSEDRLLLKLTPAHLKGLLAFDRDAKTRVAHCFVIGGEQLTTQLLQEWQTKLSSGTVLVNEYGPTETVVGCCIYTIISDDLRNLDTSRPAVLIGKPIANTELLILDTERNLVPIGVPGELYIGGAGVARGYRNRADLTAERFIDVPSTKQDGTNKRLYKTGDKVKRLADGNLEFFSRIDDQVKIRGFRIELGEIQSRILAHSTICDAVVIAQDHNGQNKLVAYIVLNKSEESPISSEQQAAFSSNTSQVTDDLRVYLKQFFPDYMLPSAIVVLADLPLTPNGKVDKKALPKPDFSAMLIQNYQPPSNEVEQQLCDIWAKLLRLERVGVTDNFFEIGGDSILTLQLVSRASQAGLPMSAKQVFENQTIRELAVALEAGIHIIAPQEEVLGDMPLLPIQRQFFSEPFIAPDHYNQALVLQTPAYFSTDMLKQIVTALYHRHDALRLRFSAQIGTTIGKFVPYQMSMLDESIAYYDLKSCSSEQRTQFLQDAIDKLHQTLAIENGCLIKAAFFDYGNEPGRLFIAIHHLVIDGVSWRVLLADIEQALFMLQQGQPVALMPKTSSYKQWGEALLEFSRSADVQQELPYWLAQLSVPVPYLPVTAVELNENTLSATQVLTFCLSKTDTTALLSTANRAYRTQTIELLMVAMLMGLQRWTGQKNMRIDLEGHGREELFDYLDISNTLGWFTNIYPFTVAMPADSRVDDFVQSIKAVKEQYRNIPLHGIGYGILTALTMDSQLLELSATQPHDIIFNYLGQIDQTINFDTQLKPATEGIGTHFSLQRVRSHVLGFNAIVSNSAMHFTLDYNPGQLSTEQVEGFRGCLVESLQSLVQHCLQPGVGSVTPSDFPLAAVTQHQLDEWQEEYPHFEHLYATTPMQQGMLFHNLLETDRAGYVNQIYLTLENNLNLPLFKRAWQTIIARHDIFRTAFVGMDGQQILQLVLPSVDLPWFEEDHRHENSTAVKTAFTAYREQDKEQGFDIRRAPLMRMSTWRVADEKFYFLWTFHHTVLDGWCLPIVFGEVLTCYKAYLDGVEPLLPETNPYMNYIRWLQQQDHRASLRYWQAELAEIEAPTPLILDTISTLENVSHLTDKSNTLVPSVLKHQALRLSTEVTQALNELARSTHTTLNTIVRAAWGYCLHRYSGEDRVVFGATVSGRPPAVRGVEQMVGLFINTIPVKIDFSTDSDITALLQSIHEATIQQNEHAYVSLAEIQQVSGVAPGTALFESLLIFENYPIEDALSEASRADSRSESLKISDVATEEGTNYKFTLAASPGEQLGIQAGYHSHQISDLAVQRCLVHLEQIFIGLANASTISLHNLPIYSQQAQDELFTAWNDTAQDYSDYVSEDTTIPSLFERQVRLTPDRMAVVFEADSLSFNECNQRANQIAHYLRSRGISIGSRVGIYIGRSVHTLPAILGVMKAGAAYVPMDPIYPAERILHIVEDSDVNVVLTIGDIRDNFPSYSGFVICLDEEDLTSYDSGNLAVDLSLTDTAYVIYTSGTTGKAKGIQMHHQGPINLMMVIREKLWQNQPLNYHVSLNASINFDASVQQIVQLLLGATIYPVPELERVDPPRLLNFLRQNALDVFDCTPSQLSALLDVVAASDKTSLPKNILVGGEAITPDLWLQLCDLHRDCGINSYNVYGPTECAVDSTMELITHQLSSPTIGFPIPNASFYVLDKRLRPVPLGAPGELHIGGVGVAKGYLNRAELTAEKFICNPFVNDTKAIIYKTGDITRYRIDGRLEYIGRTDDQVKIRGFRMELGEIEVALTNLQEVKSAAVVVYTMSNGSKVLLAYITLSEDATMDTKSMRRQLRDHLPAYMVPSKLITLDKMPLTANGKINRASLPKPITDDEFVTDYVAPSSTTEKALAEIWCEVLGLEKIGIDDNFFELGGHSLLATQVISRAHVKFDVQLDLRVQFEEPTIRVIASLVDEALVEKQLLQTTGNGDDDDEVFDI